MPDTYELDCRLCDDNREQFDSIDAVNDSDWTEVSPMGAVSNGVSVHKAYCPGHSLED
jgi:hypothetical protein